MIFGMVVLICLLGEGEIIRGLTHLKLQGTKSATCALKFGAGLISCRVFPSGGGGLGGTPHELYVSPHNSCVPPIKLKNCPPPIFVDHDKNFFRYFFNLCMTKANLTSITSLRMQLYCLIEILKQQQLKSLK